MWRCRSSTALLCGAAARATLRARWIATLVACLWFGPAFAQIMNVQSLAGKPVAEGPSGRVAATGSWSTGNVLLLQATGSATLFYRAGDSVMLLTATGNYGNKGTGGALATEPFRESVFEHLRFRRSLLGGLSAEAFVQHEYDRFRRLRVRGLAGLGGRFDHEVSKDAHVAIGVAAMAQVEELLDPLPGDLQGLYREYRLSSYVSGSVRPADALTLTATLYVQPNLRAANDVRGLLDAGLQVAVTSHVALTVGLVIAWDTAPPVAVRGLDTTSTVGLAWAF